VVRLVTPVRPSDRFDGDDDRGDPNARSRPHESYEAYTDYGRQASGRDAVHGPSRPSSSVPVNFLVTSIDREGTANGYDVTLTKTIAQLVSIPVIAGGVRREDCARA